MFWDKKVISTAAEMALCFWECIFKFLHCKISSTFSLANVYAVLFLAFYLKTQSVLPLLFFSWVHMLVFTTDIFSSTEVNITEVWVELLLTFPCRLTLVFLGFLFNRSGTFTVAEFHCCLWALKMFLKSWIPGDQFTLDFHSNTDGHFCVR